MAGIPYPGGFSGATTSGVSTPVLIPKGTQQFWVNASAAAFLAVRGPVDAADPSAAINPMNLTNAAPLAAGLYGPFDIISGYHTYVHVGGNGGTPTVTVTFV